jgi:hypothetical protein
LSYSEWELNPTFWTLLALGADTAGLAPGLPAVAGLIQQGMKNRKMCEAGSQFTRSSLKLGQKMHKLYRADQILPNVRIKEFILPSKNRIDFIDLEKKIIYELKPNNPRSISDGYKQLDRYLKEVESIYGSGWKAVLDTY